MSRAKEFKHELKALLEKYGASIMWVCSDCSDTYGLHDERMIITDKNDNELVAVNGESIDASDLK